MAVLQLGINTKMNKSDHTILIWVLSWAGVLLALLYSPFGSPELYHPQKYFAVNMGVDFSKMTILNAPSSGYVGGGSYNELEITVEEHAHRHNYNYSVNETGFTVLRSAGAILQRSSGQSYTNQPLRANSTNSTTSSRSANSSGGGETGGDGATMTYNAQRGVSHRNQAPEVIVSIPQLDLSLFSDSTSVSSAEAQRQQAGGLTGLDGSPIESVPVGDGWVFLLVLAGIYGAFKYNVLNLLIKKAN
jgi:hypothetical protein